MPNSQILVPADQLAATNKVHFPNESAEYRAARNALLLEEIELRDISNACLHRGGPCQKAGRCRRILSSFQRVGRRGCRTCLEARTR